VELEHRFEVPVGIDSAWPSLLDMSQVADCFPGATLSSADGDTYIGSVKVKLGPIQLTYQGKARIVEADESAHRAVIEASGSASRSASTASMTVTATATALDDDHTAVNMATSLTITGRPAQFGRGVMVEVGNKILGQFADCLSGKLAASIAPAAASGVSAASAVSATSTAAATATEATPAASVASEGAGSGADGDPGASGVTAGGDLGAGEEAGSRAGTAGSGSESGLVGGDAAHPASPSGPAAEPGSTGGSGAEAAESSAHTAATASSASESGPRATAPTDSGPAVAGPRHAASYTRSPEPIDLLGSAGPSILKRVVPLIASIILLIVVRAIVRGRRRAAD
jgi:carbon monoxide dehydrogenase subunit G